MESIEEIAERIAHPIIGAGAGVTAGIIDALISDPAFRRLMAEELVKVDMEPEPMWFGVDGYSKDQLTAAVLKEREECAKVCDEGYFENGARQSLRALGWSDAADTIRSRTERTE
jgi:hypothetical protein